MLPLTIAIQMDPPHRLNPAGDSTLILALEAQLRGHRLYYYEASALFVKEAVVRVTAQPVTFHERPENWCVLEAPETFPLADMDVVLMRQDPPFDMRYLSATYLLERVHPKTLVVNDPASVRNLPEKLYPLDFAEYMPETVIASRRDVILDFFAEHRDVIIKPLYGHGGNAVFRLREGGDNVHALLEHLAHTHAEPLIVQRFLPEVATEDRRVIMIDGKVEGVAGRLPASGEIRANFRVGGTGVAAELTPRQREICAAVGPSLREQGILFAGLDLIGDWLTEINITSPTGLRAVKDLYGIAPEAAFWDAVERKVS